jgi:hypothetical protein
VVVPAALLLSAGGAFAYFTSSGSGSADATVATAASLTISPGSATGDLSPGGSGDVVLSFSNPNPISIHVNSLELDKSQGEGGFGSSAGCSDPQLSFTSQNNGGAGWDVPAKSGTLDGTLDLTLAGAVTMGAGASDDCQGATFTIYLTTGP